jgi:hypothetical protein
MTTRFHGYDRAWCVLTSHPDFYGYCHMAAHHWFVCDAKEWCAWRLWLSYSGVAREYCGGPW